ncbi:MAG: sterol desaturase family protein, partial [Candidatus Eremiobacteraeota bacterium]|nr:sterol desaturase family protein [Candidatus Eremiobacteraeota bacterium]
RRLQHRLHYDHHLEPAKLELLFLPPWFLGPNLTAFGAAYAVLGRDRGLTASLVLGDLVGLLYYEWVHYVAHVPFRPRTPFGRWIKKYHLRHHFKNEKMWFGVTNPCLDALTGTYAGIADVERSDTTRLLFPEPELATQR